MNITYLFGAGASADAIPTIKNIPSKLNSFRDYLRGFNERELHPSRLIEGDESSIKKACSQFIDDILRTLFELSRSTSIDTLAKRLFIKSSPDYHKLKALMMTFFAYTHFESNGDNWIRRIDPRYDNFFASIIQKNFYDLPNIKILSWNYDMQFEMAFEEYSDVNNLIKNQLHLQVFPSHEVRLFAENRFGIVKLNGSLQVMNQDEDMYPVIFSNKSMDRKAFGEWLIDSYKRLIGFEHPYPYLFFSWENQDINKRTKSIACEIAKSTDILVVIGYTFPYFNREWDKEIIGNMKQLKKVFFQAPSDDLHNYPTRFKAILKKNINQERISDLNQFFIPPELS